MVKNKQIDDSYWLSDKDTPYYLAEHTYEELVVLRVKMTVAISAMKGSGYIILKGIQSMLKSPKNTLYKAFKYFSR